MTFVDIYIYNFFFLLKIEEKMNLPIERFLLFPSSLELKEDRTYQWKSQDVVYLVNQDL